MATIDQANLDYSSALYESNWRQGALFRAPSVRIAWNDIAPDHQANAETVEVSCEEPGPEDYYIVVSQDCDIVHDLAEEPYIEVMLCKVADPEADIASIERNNPRHFLVDPATRLIATAVRRTYISKAAALSLPKPTLWSGSKERYEQFVRWLGRRYTRPALPDDFNDAFTKPVASMFSKLGKGQRRLFSDAVREVRILFADQGARPYEIQLLIILERESLTSDEQMAVDNFLRKVETIAQNTDSIINLDRNYLIADPSRISVETYFKASTFYLDYYTYRGDLSQGSVPLGRSE